jgi:hypothetical protein
MSIPLAIDPSACKYLPVNRLESGRPQDDTGWDWLKCTILLAIWYQKYSISIAAKPYARALGRSWQNEKTITSPNAPSRVPQREPG